MGEKRSNHTVYNVNYHFVWCCQSEIDCLQISDLQCPKYRHAILEPIEESLEASFRAVCDEYGYEILSSSENHRFSGSRETVSLERLHISPDHVHLFLSAHPKWFERRSLSSSRESSILERHAPSEIVRTVKSITAREMWERYESYLEEYLWGGGFWAESYYVGTAGDVSTDTIEQYIKRTERV